MGALMLSVIQAFQKMAWERPVLTEAQRRMYTAEKLENFRWISKLVATYSKYEMKEEDVVSEELCLWLREVGQFAEVVYATSPLELLLKHYDSVNQHGFPLEGYYALSPHPYRSSVLPIHYQPFTPRPQSAEFSAVSSGVRLLGGLRGQVAKLPAAVFSRWIHEHSCLNASKEQEPEGLRRGCTCTRRRQQIIVSICGTSSVQQAIHDLRAIRRPFPSAPQGGPLTVHTGFWDLYQGMKAGLIEGILKGLELDSPEDPGQLGQVEVEYPERAIHFDGGTIRELVVTGHSMGGAIAHLLCVDLLSSPRPAEFLPSPFTPSSPSPLSSSGEARMETFLNFGESVNDSTAPGSNSFFQRLGLASLEIITFGEPRTGNQGLVDYWVALKKHHQENCGIPIREWCVKSYNDGVPSLPLASFGYRHFCQEPLYTVNGKVYRVPYEHRESALFRVAPSPNPSSSSCLSSQCPSDSEPGSSALSASTPASHSTAGDSTTCPPIPLSPLGGHNYYNERDLEGRYLRRMDWLEKARFDREGWEGRYQEIIQHHTIVG